MNLLVEYENGKYIFSCSPVRSVRFFCAMLAVGSFQHAKYNEEYNSAIPKKYQCAPKGMFEALCTALIDEVKARRFEERRGSDAAGIFFFGDQVGGIGHRFLFPHIPKSPVIIGKYKCTPRVSPEFRNGNTRNMCQYFTIRMEAV